jgi:hypothetical protein
VRGCVVCSLRPRSRLSRGSGGGLMVSVGSCTSAIAVELSPDMGSRAGFLQLSLWLYGRVFDTTARGVSGRQ